MYQEFTTKSPEETFALGREIGSSLKGGEILALVGDLASGKTTFIQGLAVGLGIFDRVLSPTFLIMRTYQDKADNKQLHHLDLYRLESPANEELKNLGIDQIWARPGHVVVVEWADRALTAFPKGTTWIYFQEVNEFRRKIKIKNETNN